MVNNQIGICMLHGRNGMHVAANAPNLGMLSSNTIPQYACFML